MTDQEHESWFMSLSSSIRRAVEDLEACEKNDKYKINMGQWHKAYEYVIDVSKDEKTVICNVCFAGSVMANTLGIGYLDDAEPQDFNDEVRNALHALDYARSYDIIGAAGYYGMPSPKQMSGLFKIERDFHENYKDVSYRQSPEIFKKNMLRIAEKLEGIGL